MRFFKKTKKINTPIPECSITFTFEEQLEDVLSRYLFYKNGEDGSLQDFTLWLRSNQ